jgi:tetratricopeptide (TPR) repeat protein
MNKVILTLLFFSVAFNAKAQLDSATANSKPPLYWLYHNSYNMAMRYSDVAEAKSALYSLINIEPQNDSLRYNLAYIYFDNKQYASAILVGMDILASNPTHAPTLELSAIAYEELGLKDKALSSYQSLYNATEDIVTLYKITYLQYELKRYVECNVNFDILLENEETDSKTLYFQVSEEEQKPFSLKVAVLNLRGLVKKEQGDIEGAKADFNAVLDLAPNFIFAQNNLKELDK